MSLLNTTGDFFSLDISANGIRVVSLRGTGKKTLVKYASAPIEKRVVLSDAPADKQLLMQAVKNLIKAAGITEKNVVVGIPPSKTFITVVDMPKLDGQDMDKSVGYQASQFIPMSAEDAKIDWTIMGDSPLSPDKSEVLIASVTNDYGESRLDLLESIGLNVIAMEPDQFALARSLVPVEYKDAVLVLDMGELATNIVTVYKGFPRLVRSIPIGGEALVKTAMQNLSVETQQALQFVYKFGLMKDKLEGQVYRAIEGVVENLVDEVDKTIKFFGARYPGVKLAKLIVAGELAILPEFPLYLANHVQIPVEIGDAWVNVSYPASMKNELFSVSHQFSVAVGLAERSE